MNGRKIAAWLGAGAVLGAAVLAGAFLGAGYFLEAPARPPAKADLLVALGGDDGGRVVGVVQLYRKGFAPRVLLTGPEGVHSKVRASMLQWRLRYLTEEGIPAQAILLEPGTVNSWEEATYTLRLMREMKLDRVLVVSDPPHMRRLSWVWGKVFEGSGKSYILVAGDAEDWDARYWWRTSPNAQFVFAEYIKLAYYFFKY